MMRPAAISIAISIGLAIAAAACEIHGVLVTPEPSLERMVIQPRMNAYGTNPYFTDQRAMRRPPEGTIDRNRSVGQLDLTHGIKDDRYVDKLPIPLTRALLERGRDRFAIFCAACHGIAGEGVSAVARKMQSVKPPDLTTGKPRMLSDGYLFRVVTEGFGLMPSYAAQLDVRDRWAVVAYVRALELSRRVRLSDLPESLRREASLALSEGSASREARP
jgi:mono/diheme cytochrome c family protein